MAIYCGIDWAEKDHQVAVVDDGGELVAERRISNDPAGLTELLMLLAEHTGGGRADEFVSVDVAVEAGRGLMMCAVRAAGHRVFEINPKAASRYRDRYGVAGAKSDRGDARVLAHLLRTDRAHHRPMPVDSEQVTALGVLARAHQDTIWSAMRETRRLRSLLREFFPAALQTEVSDGLCKT
jgi:transposase